VRRPDNDMRSSRRSYTFYPVDSPELAERMKVAYPIEGFYTYLLLQDLDHVVPYSIGRDGGERARVVGRDADDALPLIAEALSERSYPSLQDGIRQFVNRAAQQLVLGGPCTYEVAFLSRANAPAENRPVGFRLELVTPGTLGERSGAPIQYVLPTLSTLRDRNGLSYVELDPATLVRFTLPGELEKPVRRLVQFLITANQEQGKEFGLMETSVREKTDYNFSAHKRERGELFAQVSQPVGWNIRDLFPDNQLEALQVWRRIRFLEFKVRVRDSILARLNDVIALAGVRVGFEAAVELEGLPTIQDVEAAKDDLKTGRRGLGDLALWAI
jgi:hypothetical protein